MTGTRRRWGVIVLAAGAGQRFGGSKLLALLDGRPLLQYVIDAVETFRPAACVAVLGRDADVAERLIVWRSCGTVRNPAPERGVASSLAIGMAAMQDRVPPLDGVFVALGDQPLVRPETFHALADAAATDAGMGSRQIVVPCYSGEDAGVTNPALLLRDAWPMVAEAAGDRGMGPLIAAHPERVVRVPVPGANPDVDTPEDLRRL